MIDYRLTEPTVFCHFVDDEAAKGKDDCLSLITKDSNRGFDESPQITRQPVVYRQADAERFAVFFLHGFPKSVVSVTGAETRFSSRSTSSQSIL